MDHWNLTAVVVLLGAAIVGASVNINSVKFEVFDKELIQNNLTIIAGADKKVTVDGTVTTTKPVGNEYSV